MSVREPRSANPRGQRDASGAQARGRPPGQAATRDGLGCGILIASATEVGQTRALRNQMAGTYELSAQDTMLLLAALAGWFLVGSGSAAAVLVSHFATRGVKHHRQPTERPPEEIDVEDLLSDISARLPKIIDELNAALAEARGHASAIGEPAERMLAGLTEKIEQERDQCGQNVAEAYAAGMQIESEYWTDEEEEDPPF